MINGDIFLNGAITILNYEISLFYCNKTRNLCLKTDGTTLRIFVRD